MFALYQALPDSIEYRGHLYALNLSFDRVLACLDIRSDPQVPDEQRAELIARALGLRARNLTLRDKAVIVEAVFREYIWMGAKGESSSNAGAVKAFDFKIDAGLIYAAFRQAYGIDLLEYQGRLHWWQFYSLFQGLPKGTKIREVMQIRSCDIPAPTKYNQAEIRNLHALKQLYALPGAISGDSYAQGLVSLWDTLERQAKKQ